MLDAENGDRDSYFGPVLWLLKTDGVRVKIDMLWSYAIRILIWMIRVSLCWILIDSVGHVLLGLQ